MITFFMKYQMSTSLLQGAKLLWVYDNSVRNDSLFKSVIGFGSPSVAKRENNSLLTSKSVATFRKPTALRDNARSASGRNEMKP